MIGGKSRNESCKIKGGKKKKKKMWEKKNWEKRNEMIRRKGVVNELN